MAEHSISGAYAYFTNTFKLFMIWRRAGIDQIKWSLYQRHVCFCNPRVRAESHQQERVRKLCSATLNLDCVFSESRFRTFGAPRPSETRKYDKQYILKLTNVSYFSTVVIFTYTSVSFFISSNIPSGNELNGLSNIVLKKQKQQLLISTAFSYVIPRYFMLFDVLNAVISNKLNSIIRL